MNWFFVGTLIVCCLLIRFVPKLDMAMTALARRFVIRAFPTDAHFEHNKFALLRILFGLIIFVRGVHIYSLLLEPERFSVIGLWVALEMIAGALLSLGLLSQWALIFLIGAMWQFGDPIVGKSTLGNDIGAILALLLLLVNAGKYLSIDAALLKRLPALRWGLLYYRGAPGQEAVFYAKFAALSSYWAVCVYSLGVHLNEPAWMSGSAGPLLMSNNFMFRWHEYTSALLASSELAMTLAKLSIWMMMLWYSLVLPFVLLGGLFRKYIIYWGWLFFALSLFGLQLGYLAEIEVVLWLALFWSSSGMNSKHSLEVLYDDRCNLCDRTVQAVTLLDVFGRITLRPLSKSRDLLDKLGLDMDQAMTDLYGFREQDRARFHGYNFYIELSRSLVLLWPILPILWLGKVLVIGPLIYRFIADRRTRLFGVCELPRRKFLNPPTVEISPTRFPQGVALHVTLLIGFYLASVPAPYLGWTGIPNDGAKAAHVYGITPIDVFNATDLRMAEGWFVLKSIDFDETVPLFSGDGSRLSMNRSDRVYFGNTVRFRRGIIDSEGCRLESWKTSIAYLSKVYLQLKNSDRGEYEFTYTQMHQPLVSSADIMLNRFSRAPIEPICEIAYTVSYPE